MAAYVTPPLQSSTQVVHSEITGRVITKTALKHGGTRLGVSQRIAALACIIPFQLGNSGEVYPFKGFMWDRQKLSYPLLVYLSMLERAHPVVCECLISQSSTHPDHHSFAVMRGHGCSYEGGLVHSFPGIPYKRGDNPQPCFPERALAEKRDSPQLDDTMEG